ncbi:hypothetical protein R1sor_011102 [Riccia sorocarpa]|uniref:Uncharacterized protein n=1 Tax=Riccia sorocarpa TaxID=122646 RepID=A0ABD3I157_9MARC
MAGKGSSLKFLIGGLIIAILWKSAQLSREALGAHNLSRTEDLSWADCLDMGTGSLACAVKQVAKLYTFSLRGGYVEKAKTRAFETIYRKAINEGLAHNIARDKANKSGKEAGKLASRKHKRITGPLIAGAWEFFEVLYYGGSLVEGTMKGAGTVGGTWVGGALGEWKLGRIGYMIGSQVGSWFGGELGLMLYDVCNGMRLLAEGVVQFFNGVSPEQVEYAGEGNLDSVADY